MLMKNIVIKSIDIILIISLATIGLFLTLYNQSPQILLTATVKLNGKTVQTLHLNDDQPSQMIYIKQDVILELEQGKIRFAESDCPDKICVNTGWLSKNGQVAVCLPRRVSVEIRGEGGVDFDAWAY